ncbi:MAG: DNA mismatch repair endonuclease MutL [candidate division WOR-3 bacterium]
MGRIKLLAEETIRKIAAGEVITRPASVVKELIENSIDANSTTITIEIRQGGKDLIRVIDDGIGMDREDLCLAVNRHATSKLNTIDDLLQLKTMGFRGEALAAIAAVARMKIETNTDSALTGNFLEVHSGVIKEIKEIARAKGTTVSVESLFYNLPVRRGFLKSENYELKLIIETIKSYAIAYPGIHFIVRSDGKELLVLPKANSVKERLELLMDQYQVDSLIEVSVTHPILSISGFLTEPSQAQAVYEIQQIFFNQRPVRNRTVLKAIYEGYGPTLRGNNPNFIIFITTNPENLDVNIHPTKQEVKFVDERFLFDFVSEAVRKTLGIKKSETMPESELHFQERLVADEPVIPGFWQLHNSFIFAQVQSGYCIIDQHAAHERIIYEEVLKKEAVGASQGLLFPIIIELKPEEFAIFQEIAEILSSMRIEAKIFSGRTIVVESIPAGTYLGKQEIVELFQELSKLEKKDISKREAIAKLIACKGAVKAGQRLTAAEMESLINRLFACAEPYFCPHGRPVIIKITLDDLAKRFGRA